MKSRSFLMYIMLFFSSTSGMALTEKLGSVELTDILIKPYFELREPQEGEFQLGESSLQFTWFMESHFQSKVRIGPKSLLNSMARFASQISTDIGLIEAYGQYSSVYGQVRAGMIPIHYGAEGSLSEAELYFPRHNLFEQRVIPLRDMGLEFSVQHNGYYSDIKVHNGEGETNSDGRMWVSGNWGWKDRKKFQLGFAGLTGTTKPIATLASLDTLANVDVNREARWRMGTFFLRWFPSEWKTIMEVSMGEVEQGDTVVGKFSGGHVDVIYEQKNWAGMARWQYFEPNTEVKNDLKRESSIGFIIKNESQTSQLKVIGSKIVEDGQQQANDELRIIWQLTPLVTSY